LFVGEPSDIVLMISTERKISSKYATCLGGIDFAGRFEDGLAANGILILFNRPARQKINFAAEEVFEFIVEFIEVPSEMDIRSKGNEQVNIASRMPLTSSERAEHFKPGNAVTQTKRRESGF